MRPVAPEQSPGPDRSYLRFCRGWDSGSVSRVNHKAILQLYDYVIAKLYGNSKLDL
jgi:hypothetical protein